jgi:hypothetical protein
VYKFSVDFYEYFVTRNVFAKRQKTICHLQNRNMRLLRTATIFSRALKPPPYAHKPTFQNGILKSTTFSTPSVRHFANIPSTLRNYMRGDPIPPIDDFSLNKIDELIETTDSEIRKIRERISELDSFRSFLGNKT